MANEDSVLREVDQELAEDRQWELFRKRGPLVIAGAVAIVAGVAVWQFWNARTNSIAEVQALEFREAVELLAQNRDSGRAALGAVAEEGGGYGVLAQFHRAASFAQGGERLKAVEIYREIYNKGAAPKRVRELARLRAAYLSLSDGRDVVLKDLGHLPEADGAYGVYAREISALAALGAKDYETALAMFRQLSIDISAPLALRTRAEDFAALAAAGKAGVNITGETRVDDLLKAVGEDMAADDAATLPPAETGEESGLETQTGEAPETGGALDESETE